MTGGGDERWSELRKFMGRGGPLCGPGFEPDFAANWTRLRSCRILVVGAGGLGCEILKDLALSGFGDLSVIDMDTVDHSNLNRQFLFRPSDVSRPKSTTAANFVNARVPGANVTPIVGSLQSKPREWYRQFELVVSGLDSVQARRWLNFTLCGLVTRDEATGEIDASSVIPMLDSGTEGFKGHARVILPGITACFECAIDAFPPQVTFPVCTIASEPRLPEHCVQWASEVLWSQERRSEKLDMDVPEHVDWVYSAAKRRAEEKGIPGVTRSLTLGVVKGIIPAIASTNALVAAAVCLEAWKYVTAASQGLDNYLMYNGSSGVYTYTFEYARKESCMACQVPRVKYAVAPRTKLGELIRQLGADPHFQFQAPSLTTPGRNLFMQQPEALRSATAPNLTKSLEELGVSEGTELTVSDPVLPVALLMSIEFIGDQQ